MILVPSFGIAIVMASPYLYLFDLIHRLIFTSPAKWVILQIVFLTVGMSIYFVMLFFIWKWLKDNLAKILQNYHGEDGKH